ncbi:MAG: alanine racemase [Deltaproteobacteria bacterium]|nr:alanine racemase [Deltaproteobacteria bacterium]
MRPTRVEIDLCAIKENIKAIRAATRTKVMMAIKADAYGHGAQVVGRFVQDHNLVDMLGVSSIEEGIHLRDAGVSLPILIFGLISNTKEDADAVFSYRLIPTLVDETGIDELIKSASRWNRPAEVHIKTDTGMGRLGHVPERTIMAAVTLSGIKELVIKGIYTHFPVSDTMDNAFTDNQIQQFIAFHNRLLAMGIFSGITHCANSGAVLNYPESYLDMVRPGLLCYGLYPSDLIKNAIPVRPAMSLKTAVVFVKKIKKGSALSYGLTYQLKKDSNIATIPIGYADGYPRILSNSAHVLIRGKTYPVVGRICMDQSLIDLGEDLYPVGEEVLIFGKEIITAQSVASWGNTIPYEITCNMSRRVRRTYSENSQGF